ncbi:MAG: DUF882 domain-containing protein [Nitrospirota bacterium]
MIISRRGFLRALAASPLLLTFKKAFAFKRNERILRMSNVHTQEQIRIKYCDACGYDYAALERINYFLRCHYTDEVKTMDIRVIDVLCDIKNTIDEEKEVTIISGYRSKAYNDLLLRQGRGVSPNSFHLRGLAIDFTIEGVSNEEISRIARSLASGGVGEYSEFVHIDVGPVRYW